MVDEYKKILDQYLDNDKEVENLNDDLGIDEFKLKYQKLFYYE